MMLWVKLSVLYFLFGLWLFDAELSIKWTDVIDDFKKYKGITAPIFWVLETLVLLVDILITPLYVLSNSEIGGWWKNER